MAAINFPDNPSVSGTFTVSDNTWMWTGSFWELLPYSVQGVQGIQGVQGPVGPSGIISDTSQIPNSSGINNIIYISQANYDALGSYSNNTVYIIKD